VHTNYCDSIGRIMNNFKQMGEKKATSVAELAATHSLSQSFIRKEIREGRLPAKNAGRRVIIFLEDFQRYLDGDRQGSKS